MKLLKVHAFPRLALSVFSNAILLAACSVIANGKPSEATYDVWGGNVLDLGKLYYNVDKFGWVKLGTSDKTAFFEGTYKYYLIAVKPTEILYLDAAQASDGEYYGNDPFASNYLVVGDVRGETTERVFGAPDHRYLVMDGPKIGSASKSTYGAFVIFENIQGWNGMKFFVYSKPTKPKAPTGVKLQVTSAKAIQVSWTDNSKNETAFVIQHALSKSGPWHEADQVNANITSTICQPLKPGTRYFFRVRALNQGRKSAFSKTASAVTRQATGQPLAQWMQQAFPFLRVP